MPVTKTTPRQSRQDRPGVVEKSTPVVSMPEPAAHNLPDWLEEVEPCSYTLCMYDPWGSQIQAAWMQHEEYLMARTVIASLRLRHLDTTLAIGNEMDKEAYDKLKHLERLIGECAEIVERHGHLLAKKEEEPAEA